MFPSARHVATLFGIRIRVHWSWAVVGLVGIVWRRGAYDSVVWNVVEYLALFGIVLLHELGHALACRSVGGRADDIMLWPLGGVAHVDPPQRPGALLWSVAAGPLVNVVLLPVCVAGAWVAAVVGAPEGVQQLAFALVLINLGLLIFNLLPVYPLDGGQIVRALLWYAIGRERSLLVAAGFGLVASVVLGGAAVVLLGDLWLGLIAAFAAFSSYQGVRAARAMLSLPRHDGLACPGCGEAPPRLEVWTCPAGHAFDAVLHDGTCPTCHVGAPRIGCPFCGTVHALSAFRDLDGETAA